MAGDRFAVREVQQALDKKKKAERKSKELGEDAGAGGAKNKYKSGKFFNAMNAVSKSDKERKDLKRHAKDIGKADGALHNNSSAKKFKM